MSRLHGVRAVAAVVAFGAVVAIVWWMFPSNARRVRTQFLTLAKLASVPADEPDLARLARARKFSIMLARDISVSFDDGTSGLNGREAVALLVAQPTGIRGGVNVGLSEVAVDVGPGGTEATSTGRARATFTDSRTGQLSSEERGLTLVWHKIDGDWLVSSVRVGGW
jgi:hypothetical protein